MNDREVARERVRRAADALRRHDLMREALMRDRDRLMADAREAGVPWLQIGEDAGLSPGAVHKVLSRKK